MQDLRQRKIGAALAAAILAIVLSMPLSAPAATVTRIITRASGVAGETLAEGDWVAIKAADGLVYKAKADDTTLRPAVGVVAKGGASGANVEIITRGQLGGLTSLTKGAPVYLHTTAGSYTQAIPSYGQQLGVALSATTMTVEPAAPIGPNLIQTATIALTNAQIKALRATPITVVAAPGAGKVIVPIAAYAGLVYGGTNAFTGAANDNLALKWKDGTGAALMTGGVQAWVQATASAISLFVPAVAAGSTVNVAKTAGENMALVVHNPTAGEIAGNAANDNTISLTVQYVVLSTGL